jgi:hypothetical protein
MLLINYKIDTENKSFIITKVFLTKLKSCFFEHIISEHFDFFKFLAETTNPFKNFNEKRNKETKTQVLFLHI